MITKSLVLGHTLSDFHIYLPNITVSSCSIVVIIGSLSAEFTKIEFGLYNLSKGSYGHGTCRSLLLVESTIIAFNVGVSTDAIWRINGRSRHANLLLGKIACRGTTELFVMIV